MRVVLTRREGLDSPDGVSIFIVAMAQALIEMGHDVKVVVGSLESTNKFRRLLAPRLELPVVALSDQPLTGLASIAGWLRARRLIDDFQPDLVIHSEAVPIPLRGTVVQAVHDLQPRQGLLAPAWRTIRRAATRRCDHVVATTTELRNELVRDLGLPRSRFALIPKCIDRSVYRRRDLGGRERAILHAGTLAYKDPAASIRAFGALDDPSARLYISGDPTDAVRQALDALPARLRECVKLMGTDGDLVRDLHSRVRVASFPTQYAVPVASATVMEAIATGTPIVGSATLSRDVLIDGGNGLVVDSQPDAMAAAFAALLNDDLLWSRLSAGAIRLSERFDAFRVAGQYLDLMPVSYARDHSAATAVGHPVADRGWAVPNR